MSDAIVFALLTLHNIYSINRDVAEISLVVVVVVV